MTENRRRKCSNVGEGYYKLICEGDDIEEEELGRELEIDSEDGVYEVERLVEKRRRKVEY